MLATVGFERGSRHIRMATYNVHHCEGVDGRVDVGRVAATLRRTGARVMALQEVDVGLERSGGSDQARELADLTGLSVSFYPTIERRVGRYGLALLTPERAETHFVALPRRGSAEPRGAVVGTIAGLRVIATHLTTDASARRAQLARLVELARGSHLPVVLLGDMNERLKGLGPLTRAGLVSDGVVHRTLSTPRAQRMWSGWWAARRRHIDHVLAGMGAHIERSWALEVEGSDHYPLVADLSY
jgi:endonuclease/exonuclease/phosphatase family metal-dependent hydrolase